MEAWEERLNDPDARLYTIGVVAELLGTDVATIRRYDDSGIITAGRSGAGQRRYSRNDIAQLARAVHLTSEGVTPPGVRRILDLEAQLRDLRSDPQD
jgi:MerR family transcriptional regulator, heat shock protein HspR